MQMLHIGFEILRDQHPHWCLIKRRHCYDVQLVDDSSEHFCSRSMYSFLCNNKSIEVKKKHRDLFLG